MKVYVAGGETPDHAAEPRLYALGVRNRMLTFANPNSLYSAKFWFADTTERFRQMKVYVAGNGRSQIDYDTGTRNRLLSYAFIDDWAKDEFKFWIDAAPAAASVFLDSGAFSAHTKGSQIDLAKYCDYLLANRERLNCYAVLDVIGNLEGTMNNLREMRRRGLDPVPVYHTAYEPISVLEELLDGCSYVALGGMVATSLSRERMSKKLDECWVAIEKHWPIKVHGLGVTAQDLLERYPFYSCDSSSAIRGAGMGNVMRFYDRRCDGDTSFCWLMADGWRGDILEFGDGEVVDGVGRVKDATASRPSESAHQGRRVRNIQAQLALEQHLTDLWALRGVRWDS